MPQGKETFYSKRGFCFTILLVFLLIWYGAMQSIKLLTFDDTDVMVSSRDAYFDSDEEYTENLQYAFGLTAYDSNREIIEDPSIGVIKPYFKSWGIKAGVGGIDFEEIPTRPCTPEELQVENKTDPNSSFFIPHKNSIRDLEFYHKKL